MEQLAEEFGLSLMTVRRDLQFLESRQLITRFYGGATARLTSRPLTEAEEDPDVPPAHCPVRHPVRRPGIPFLSTAAKPPWTR